MAALSGLGFAPRLASRLLTYRRAFDPGDAARVERIAALTATRLIGRYRRGAPEARPRVWVTYQSYYRAPDLIGPTVAAALDIPYVLVDTAVSTGSRRTPFRPWVSAARLAVRRADLVFVMSPRDRPRVAACRGPRFAAERLLDLPPTIDATRFDATAQRRAACRAAMAGRFPGADGPVILAVAAMREMKKLDAYRLLGGALGRLHALAPARPWRLAVVGDGPARPAVAATLGAPPGRPRRLPGIARARRSARRVFRRRSLRVPRPLSRRLSPGRRRGAPGRRVRGARGRSHGRARWRAPHTCHARRLRCRRRPAPGRSRPSGHDGGGGPALHPDRPHARGTRAPPRRRPRDLGLLVRSVYVALIRHAPTAWNAEGRVLGQADPPLSPEGAARAARWRLPADLRALAEQERLGWAVSPLGRAIETARILGAVAPLVEPRLAEQDWGDWTGRARTAVARETSAAGWDAAPPGRRVPGPGPRAGARVARRARARGGSRDVGGRDPHGRHPDHRRGGAPLEPGRIPAGAASARSPAPRASTGRRPSPAHRAQ